MKNLKIPGIVNLYKVDEPEEIQALARDPVIDRQFSTRTCPFNWLLLKRSLAVLTIAGRRFPTMTPRDSQERQSHQNALADSLHARAAAIRLGPDELEPLANWIRGSGADSEVGMLTQQLLGRLFVPTFVATAEELGRGTGPRTDAALAENFQGALVVCEWQVTAIATFARRDGGW